MIMKLRQSGYNYQTIESQPQSDSLDSDAGIEALSLMLLAQD